MPEISKHTVMVTSYIDRTFRVRMRKIQQRRPRLTISKQVARCVELGLAAVEAEAGIKKLTALP